MSEGLSRGTWNKWRGPACGEETVYAAKAPLQTATTKRSRLLGWVGFITHPGCCPTASAGFGAAPQGFLVSSGETLSTKVPKNRYMSMAAHKAA
jgi:hypothetical protein